MSFAVSTAERARFEGLGSQFFKQRRRINRGERASPHFVAGGCQLFDAQHFSNTDPDGHGWLVMACAAATEQSHPSVRTRTLLGEKGRAQFARFPPNRGQCAGHLAQHSREGNDRQRRGRGTQPESSPRPTLLRSKNVGSGMSGAGFGKAFIAGGGDSLWFLLRRCACLPARHLR